MKVIDEQHAYWLAKLSGLSEAVTLPADRERSPASSFFRESRSVSISPEPYARLNRHASEATASPFACPSCSSIDLKPISVIQPL